MIKAEYLMRVQHKSQKDMALETGLCRTTINKLLHGNVPPYPKYQKAFAYALSWDGDPSELFSEVEVR